MSNLGGLAILVVEDEFLIADEIATALGDNGAHVVGPARSVEEALELIERETPFDAAVLDVDLAGRKVFPVADALARHGAPFIFATGYDADVIPERHRAAIRISKPAVMDRIVRALLAITSNTPS